MKFALTARCCSPGTCPFAKGEFCERDDCAVEHENVCLAPSVSAHEANLRRHSCVVSCNPRVTLHHCRGGSMALTPFGTPGVGQKQNDALQIPLNWVWHTGKFGIDARPDSSPADWEAKWGTQVEHLNSISSYLRYSVWALAWRWASPIVRERVERFLRESRSRYHHQ